MIRVVVSRHLIAKDSATDDEIIDQTTHALRVLKAQAMLSRAGYKSGSS